MINFLDDIEGSMTMNIRPQMLLILAYCSDGLWRWGFHFGSNAHSEIPLTFFESAVEDIIAHYHEIAKSYYEHEKIYHGDRASKLDRDFFIDYISIFDSRWQKSGLFFCSVCRQILPSTIKRGSNFNPRCLYCDGDEWPDQEARILFDKYVDGLRWWFYEWGKEQELIKSLGGESNYKKYLKCRNKKRKQQLKQSRKRYLRRPPWTRNNELAKQMALFYRNCPEGYEVDHIVPLLGKLVSGLHVPWNLQYLKRGDNKLKLNKFEPQIINCIGELNEKG